MRTERAPVDQSARLCFALSSTGSGAKREDAKEDEDGQHVHELNHLRVFRGGFGEATIPHDLEEERDLEDALENEQVSRKALNVHSKVASRSAWKKHIHTPHILVMWMACGVSSLNPSGLSSTSSGWHNTGRPVMTVRMLFQPSSRDMPRECVGMVCATPPPRSRSGGLRSCGRCSSEAVFALPSSVSVEKSR